MKKTVIIRSLMVVMLFAVATSINAGDQESEVASMLPYTSTASEAAGIGELSAVLLPRNQQEIRIWYGFGTAYVQHMLRLRVYPSGAVQGEVLVHHTKDLHEMSAKEAAQFRRDVSAGCVNFREGSEEVACTATFDREPDWRSIYRELVENGLLDLPDESVLPPPESVITDGAAIVVELRNGPKYRAYQYSNPMFRPGSQAVSAYKIMQIVGNTIGASNTAW